MNVRDHTTASNGSLDEGVELLITSDGELEVSGWRSPQSKTGGPGGGSPQEEGRRVWGAEPPE